ncbi:DMT family transporter [Halobacillus andaensis]|uniref:DMT family transporter n=1 Tax=Halobacillus andaensis TaxID=1176239 RepID=UPI003D718137
MIRTDFIRIVRIIFILCEVTGAAFMKYSDGYTNYHASLVVVFCYILAVILYIFITRDHEIGIINALWSGGITTLVTLLALFLFGESMTPLKFLGLGMILTGIIGLTLQPSHSTIERWE